MPLKKKAKDRNGNFFTVVLNVFHKCIGDPRSASVHEGKLEWHGARFCSSCGVEFPRSVKDLKDLGLIEEGESE